MRKRRQIKKPVVQLTSLLDLLFVMIFVSLLQTKSAPTKAQTKPDPKPTPQAPVKPVAKPTPKPVKPEPQKPRVMAVTATFNFYPTPSSVAGTPSGSYSMGGKYDRQTGEIQLGGTSWISRPPGRDNGDFEMVPLKGTIIQNKTFTGRIPFPGCEQFTLVKSVGGSGSEISGEWKGSYVCFQGETGLTLTID